MRSIITPGRLYAKLAKEFRQASCTNCAQCILPLPYRIDEPGEGPTWVLGPLTNECEGCVRLISQIVARHQDEFDLLDPTTPPISLNRKPPPRLRPLH